MKFRSFRSEIIIIAALIVQLIFIIYIKYDNQSLSLSNFDLSLTGNILTLIFYTFLIFEVVFLFRKNRIQTIKTFIVLFSSYLFLGLGYYSNHVQMPFNKYYFFGQYGNKLFTGLCFTIYLFTLIYFAFSLIYSKTKPKIFSGKAFLSAKFLMIVFLLLAKLFILLNENKLKGKSINPNEKNILIVLGAAVWSDNKPSPILAARVRKAAEISRNNFIDKIYFTGGNAPGERSEAEVAYEYFKGLNPIFEQVELETKTSSTNAQIQFIKNFILPKYTGYEIIVISDSFHLVRIREISNFHQIKIKTVASDFPLNIGENVYNRLRESLALIVFWLFSI